MRFALILLFTSTLASAQSWSGYLVKSSCYRNDQTNTNKYATTADRDMTMVVKQCSPNANTKSFALVLSDWSSLKLDAAGNAKAAEVVRNSGSASPLQVTVTGDRTSKQLKVASIAKTAQ